VRGQDTPFLFITRANTNGKGDKVKCEFCDHDVPALITLRVYTTQGIKVCEECYRMIDSHHHKPYSKVMDKLALVEASYHVNRKMATLTRSSWQTRR
jgi:ribosome-binding protein aMBF1 (putative translation factor)